MKNLFRKVSIQYLFSLVLSLGVIIGFLTYKHVTWKEPPVFTKLSILQQDEQRWLALAIYFEARGEDLSGQMKVAKVVLNRVRDPRWPESVFAVVAQCDKRSRCQFSFMNSGRPEEPKETDAAWVRAQFVASVAYRGFLREEVTLGCAHSYHADYATNTKWFTTLKKEKTVGAHIFYCDDESDAAS